jgi:hypothetical protein
MKQDTFSLMYDFLSFHIKFNSLFCRFYTDIEPFVGLLGLFIEFNYREEAQFVTDFVNKLAIRSDLPEVALFIASDEYPVLFFFLYCTSL